MRWLIPLALLAGCLSSSLPESAPAGDGGPPDLGTLAERVHKAANNARRANDRAPLDWSDHLAGVAERHSRDMATRRYFAHVSPDGRSPTDRAEADGVDCRVPVGDRRTRVGVLENLFQTTRFSRIRTRQSGGRVDRTVDWYSPDALARRVVDGWLDSPGHRRNLLDDVATAHGIGVAVHGDRVTITQVLC